MVNGMLRCVCLQRVEGVVFGRSFNAVGGVEVELCASSELTECFDLGRDCADMMCQFGEYCFVIGVIGGGDC